MTGIVPDASVAIKWVVPEEYSDHAERLLSLEYDLFAPSFILLECANILWKQVRFASLPKSEADTAYSALCASGMRLKDTTPLVSRGYEIALDTGRTVYDSIYVALAEQEGIQLVTADERFYNALSATPYSRYLRWIESLLK